MPPGYETPLFRKDRPDGYGGVLVAVKTGLIAEEIPINTECEMICGKFKQQSTTPPPPPRCHWCLSAYKQQQ